MSLHRLMIAASLAAALGLGLTAACVYLVQSHQWPEPVGFALTALAFVASLSVATALGESFAAILADRQERKLDSSMLL